MWFSECTYINTKGVCGRKSDHRPGLYVNFGGYFRFLIFLFIITSVQDTCAITLMEARDQESGLSIHRVVRLAQQAPITTEPSSQHITLVFAF